MRITSALQTAHSSSNDLTTPIVWKTVGAYLACALLSACGGGGGGLQSANSQAPSPPPPPPPPPPPTSFDTAEFRRSDGPGFHGAQSAWQDGAVGTNEIIAVIDTGIDSDSPEFEGRIHSGSLDIAGNRGIDPEDDHGTNVALVAAGARDNNGVLGIAFDAQILAIRADMPGSCGSDTPQNADLGCLFTDAAIADGIDHAIASDATVINLSLGGETPSADVRNAVARAANAGIVIVVAAGNGGDGSEAGIDPNQPDPFAASLQQAGNGNVIIVGSANANGGFSDFSNRAGDFSRSFITARGERICCVYENGDVFVETINGQDFLTLFSGTSFAAPQVAGAVALLAQAFPNLTGQEIVEILLDTARDAGTGGPDEVFGTGILDIAVAFRPQGQTSLAGTGKALTLTDDLVIGSAAMGDALSAASLGTIITDRYDRAYNVDLGQQARSAVPIQRLRGAVAREGLTRSTNNGALAFSITAGEGQRAAGLSWSEQLQLTPDEAQGARVLAANVAARVAPDTQIGVAISQSAAGLVAQLQGAESPAFLIAPEAGRDAGFFGNSEIAFATRYQAGPWGVSFSAERGRAWLGNYRQSSEFMFGIREHRSTSTYTLAADRQWQHFDASVALSWLSEDDMLLGAHFSSVFGIEGADSVFLDASVAQEIGKSWRIGAAFRAGLTRPRAGSLIGRDSQVASNSWSFDVMKRGAILREDSIGFRVSQPMRVSGGAIRFDLPVAYDYATESPIIGSQDLSLTPAGREIMSEINWSARTALGFLGVSAFYRSDPGHFKDASDDVGAVISLSSTFRGLLRHSCIKREHIGALHQRRDAVAH